MSKKSKRLLYLTSVSALFVTISIVLDQWLAATGILVASTITFGNTANPSNISQYMDSVFGISIQEYRKELTDNIGATNAFLSELLASDQYESCPGGSWIQEPMMFALAAADSYDGYDELSTATTDGITDAIYEWRQMASPISYNMKEVIQNTHRIADIVKSRIKQAEMGIQEGFASAFMHGALAGTGSTLVTPKVSAVNGSNGVEPLNEFLRFDPTSATSPTVGNIDQSVSTNSWWRNKTKTASATTQTGFIQELDNIYNSCALGTGGAPDIILMDQTTYELYVSSYFSKYRVLPGDAPADFPFEAKKFKRAKVVMDDKVPDAFTNVVSSATYGTAYFMNTKFFKLRYHPDRDWEMLEDENGKKFAKPINGDSRIGHVAWMGNMTCNNRRKQGIYAKIPRTLTA